VSESPNPNLVDRLAALPSLSSLPRDELEWLATRGQLESHEAGTVIAPKGEPIHKLWVILSGQVAVRVDRGTGPRVVVGWGAGEVTGMLPYSRMKSSPGNNRVDVNAEVLAIHTDQFPEMINRCPRFTAYTVHLMLDRARSFKTSDLQDEKMISLGKLSAGLAHELNNPASAIVRSAKQLGAGLAEMEAAARALGSRGLDDAALEVIDRARSAGFGDSDAVVLSPMELADREDEIADWLELHRLDTMHAATLAEMGITVETLGEVASVSGGALETAVRWIAASSLGSSLAGDIEQAGNRIYDLVGAVKRFTYMDSRGGPELVDIAPGIRDTIRVLASKAKAKGATITADLEEDLPPARASGGELNQVWMNLLDNALDAIADSGHVAVSARLENGQIVVRVVDDGEGIPADVLPRIFDPFFTTKAPGQGTGLGLEITRRLLRQFKADISVESEPGRTEFRVSLQRGEPE
jgi:signal transduction histidine kinase